MGVVDGARLEGRHCHDQVGPFQRSHGLMRVGAVELRLGMQDEIGLARLGQHARSIEPLCARYCLGDVSADRVGRLAQIAEARTGDGGQLLRQRMQCRRLGKLLRVVAEKNRCVLARYQALRNLPRCHGRLHVGQRCIDRRALRLGCGLDDAGQFCGQRRRRDD